jgi:hypothetical protein
VLAARRRSGRWHLLAALILMMCAVPVRSTSLALNMIFRGVHELGRFCTRLIPKVQKDWYRIILLPPTLKSIAERMPLELHVCAQGGNDSRAAVAVVAGIDDILHSGSEIDSAPDVRRVIRFDDILPPVVQTSIAQQEAHPAMRQVNLVILRDRVTRQRQPRAIIAAMPQGASCA